MRRSIQHGYQRNKYYLLFDTHPLFSVRIAAGCSIKLCTVGMYFFGLLDKCLDEVEAGSTLSCFTCILSWRTGTCKGLFRLRVMQMCVLGPAFISSECISHLCQLYYVRHEYEAMKCSLYTDLKHRVSVMLCTDKCSIQLSRNLLSMTSLSAAPTRRVWRANRAAGLKQAEQHSVQHRSGE
jgi:hypothetical protein